MLCVIMLIVVMLMVVAPFFNSKSLYTLHVLIHLLSRYRLWIMKPSMPIIYFSTSQQGPGACTIKLFTAVIYVFSL